MILLVLFLAGSLSAEGKLAKSIYIDPIFDEEQIGRAFSNKKTAADVARKFANNLKVHFEKKGYVANFPGKAEALVGIEDRLSMSEKKKSSIYMLITLSEAKNSCINLYYPKFQKEAYKKNTSANKFISDEFYDSLGNSLQKSISEHSALIATALSEKIKAQANVKCLVVRGSSNYILRIASYPMVIVDFGLADIDKLPDYLMNAGAKDKISKAVVDAIDGYFHDNGP